SCCAVSPPPEPDDPHAGGRGGPGGLSDAAGVSGRGVQLAAVLGGDRAGQKVVVMAAVLVGAGWRDIRGDRGTTTEATTESTAEPRTEATTGRAAHPTSRDGTSAGPSARSPTSS